ncbi:antitermination protein [Salmonella enterica]|uniref:Putative chaparone n=1 Tax=Salmonella enterica subsp. enterica serovar Uganda str. R8-3404 TaxID=913083 RepID=A0A6C8H658_SALET|nr:antitermination protein [Salmonella enterica subsp. enterica serovar Senftenberg]EAP4682306.1 antitermination protein [Salmonella enterica]EAP4751508.1 antitermination protein [Salmonella enterica subsp. enterica serovar Meleagridis]EAV4043064.1 antitermination protein [Salmonella enterica subsp. enterica serovar Uganda]EBD6823409.1 antitermination protein [Salmonella enterica subsp. enterica serovar Orion]EED4135237.1 antitermination protein [Salmonella enterica subsp. enterica]EED4241493
MKLESSLKHFSPQGMHISDDVKGTSPDRITGTDIMVAIGTTSSRARFGLAAFFGKAGISKTDEQQAVQALARHAMDTAPKNVRKAAGGEFGWCMLVLAQFAFAEYSRSAATSVTCHTCKGSGLTSQYEDVIKHPGVFNSDGMEIVPPKIKHELVKRKCAACNGKGELLARCRCGGKGEVLDRKATSERGAPVFKTCERCSGNGFSAISSATVHRAILKRLPDLHQSSWSRNWKPFYEMLVDTLHREERQAAAEFEKATSY